MSAPAVGGTWFFIARHVNAVAQPPLAVGAKLLKSSCLGLVAGITVPAESF